MVYQHHHNKNNYRTRETKASYDAGDKAEALFGQYLDDNKIPFVYIGQDLNGKTYSKMLRESLGANRPDYVVFLPDIGSILVDVKCRALKKYNEQSSAYFYLNKKESEGLINAHRSLPIPVWIVFIDRYQIGRQEQQSLYFLKVSELESIVAALKDDDELYELLRYFRIPYECLLETKGELQLNLGVKQIGHEIKEAMREKNSGLIQRLRDEIRSYIRKHNSTEADTCKKLLDNLRDFVMDTEIESVFEKMKANCEILQDEQGFVKLRGE